MINLRRRYRAFIHKKNTVWAKLVLSAWSVCVFCVVAGGLLIWDRFSQYPFTDWRNSFSDLSLPILQKTSDICRTIKVWANVTTRLSQTHSLTQELHLQAAELHQWKRLAQHLMAENKTLRQQMDMAPEHGYRVVSARVIMAPVGTLNRSLLINAGAEEGVRKNQPVVAQEGLIGRVIEVGKHTARVLLITDGASRIPAAVESSREQLILAGDNSDEPIMMHMAQNDLPQPGDVIVTSGKGGVFPPGLEIGRVARHSSPNSLRVHMPIRWNQLEFVQVLAPTEMQTAHTAMH